MEDGGKGKHPKAQQQQQQQAPRGVSSQHGTPQIRDAAGQGKPSLEKEVRELKRRLDETKKAKGPFDPSAYHLRSRLRSTYEELLLIRATIPQSSSDTSQEELLEASEQACDAVLQPMWGIHYRHIEEYRGALKQLASPPKGTGSAGRTSSAGTQALSGRDVSRGISNRPSPSTTTTAPGQSPGANGSQAAPVDLGAAALVAFGGVPEVQTSFLRFLSEASGFYLELIGKLKKMHGLRYDYTFQGDGDWEGTEAVDQGQPQAESAPANRSRTSVGKALCRMLCHRCLIYLGDFARYKEQAVASKQKDWSVACTYYQQAAAMVPSSGNPHNQLAVLASYMEDEFLALYHTFRSLALAVPFHNAPGNLTLAFNNNLKKYPAALEAGKLGEPKLNGGAEGVAEAKRIQTVRSLMTHFVRVNGILNTNASLSPFGQVYLLALKAMVSLLQCPNSDLPHALSLGHSLVTTPPNSVASLAPTAAVALRMEAVLIYTLHAIQKEIQQGGKEGGGLAGKEGGVGGVTGSKEDLTTLTYAQVLQRNRLLRHAILAVFEFTGRMIERCYRLPPGSATPISDPTEVISSPLLPAVAVFLQWLAVNPSFLVFHPPSPDPSGSSSATDEEGYREHSARMFLWGQLRVLLNLFLDLGARVTASAWCGPPWTADPTYLSSLFVAQYNAAAAVAAARPEKVQAQGVSQAGGSPAGISVVAPVPFPVSFKIRVPALWEDLELRGFEPLRGEYQGPTAGVKVDFGHTPGAEEGLGEQWSRVERMVRAGLAVAAQQPQDPTLVVLRFDPASGRFFADVMHASRPSQQQGLPILRGAAPSAKAILAAPSSALMAASQHGFVTQQPALLTQEPAMLTQQLGQLTQPTSMALQNLSATPSNAFSGLLPTPGMQGVTAGEAASGIPGAVRGAWSTGAVSLGVVSRSGMPGAPTALPAESVLGSQLMAPPAERRASGVGPEGTYGQEGEEEAVPEWAQEKLGAATHGASKGGRGGVEGDFLAMSERAQKAEEERKRMGQGDEGTKGGAGGHPAPGPAGGEGGSLGSTKILTPNGSKSQEAEEEEGDDEVILFRPTGGAQAQQAFSGAGAGAGATKASTGPSPHPFFAPSPFFPGAAPPSMNPSLNLGGVGGTPNSHFAASRPLGLGAVGSAGVIGSHRAIGTTIKSPSPPPFPTTAAGPTDASFASWLASRSTQGMPPAYQPQTAFDPFTHAAPSGPVPNSFFQPGPSPGAPAGFPGQPSGVPGMPGVPLGVETPATMELMRHLTALQQQQSQGLQQQQMQGQQQQQQQCQQQQKQGQQQQQYQQQQLYQQQPPQPTQPQQQAVNGSPSPPGHMQQVLNQLQVPRLLPPHPGPGNPPGAP